MSLKIKESELRDLLDEVAADLAKAFESEKDKLVKAEGSSSGSPEVSPLGKGADTGTGGADPKFKDVMTQKGPKLAGGTKDNPMTEKGAHLGKDDLPPEASKSPEASASGDAGAGGPPEASESTQAPDGAPSPDAPPPADPAMGGDPAAQGMDQGAPLTPEALQAEYSKLPPEELDMHIKAALSAKAALVGADGGMGASAAPGMMGAPPPGPGAGPSPSAGAPVPPPPAGPPMAMAELPPSPEQGKNHGLKLGKAEHRIDELEKLVKSQAEDISILSRAAKHLMETPIRKAITTLAYVPRVESEPKPKLADLTKADIHKHLNKLSAQPDLKKSDRQLINDWYDKRVSIEAIAPLFEDYGK